MDQTAVARHSQGRLQRDQPLEQYLAATTPDFGAFVPQLHSSGISLCVATHSDQAQHGGLALTSTHVLGSELAPAVLERHVDPTVVASFLIVAYNPSARGADGRKERNKIQRYHLRAIQQHFQVYLLQILFVDDSAKVVDDCRNHCDVCVVLVNGRIAFNCQTCSLTWSS